MIEGDGDRAKIGAGKGMIYLNQEAQKGLRECIRAHESKVGEVRGNTCFHEPLLH